MMGDPFRDACIPPRQETSHVAQAASDVETASWLCQPQLQGRQADANVKVWYASTKLSMTPSHPKLARQPRRIMYVDADNNPQYFLHGSVEHTPPNKLYAPNRTDSSISLIPCVISLANSLLGTLASTPHHVLPSQIRSREKNSRALSQRHDE
ncbi:hypothetical protein CGRA01v4_11523 [Colletotrichum graminicola]|nr:hypothetical protein CGRA01v4_11523 [Colletotrichum graminicola]